jgi:hypothetical protein
MNIPKILLAALALAGASLSPAALADHGHGHIGLGFYFGMPYPHPYYPPPYYYPYPYYPPVVVAPAQPPVYIEQAPQASAPSAATSPANTGYWYHCDNPDGYYPYIKDCPGGWRQVVPTPPAPQQ